MTTDPDRCSVAVTAPLDSSDHCLVKFVSVYSPPDQGPCGIRRVWRYKSADWDEMRHFFSAYPWRSCFSSGESSSCAEAITEVIRQGMEYFIPYSDIPSGSKARPWFDADCDRAEARKQEAYTAWADARTRKAPNTRELKKNFNRASRLGKKELRRARFDRIRKVGAKLASYPAGSNAFWSLAKAVEANFCQSSLPPLQRPADSLAH